MNLELVAVSGKWRGVSWPITDVTLVLGRGDDVDIQIPYRTVSRHHCHVVLDPDGHVVLKDLGSRNPALVNGLPARDSLLRVGDELGVGPMAFLICNSSYTGASGGSSLCLDAVTRSWADDVAADTPNGTGAGDWARPRTVDDLALLYGAARDFGGCTTTRELFACLRQSLERRFMPAHFWAARAYGERQLLVLPSGEDSAAESAEPPLNQMVQVLHHRHGLATPIGGGTEKSNTPACLLGAPVCFAGIPLGVVAMQIRSPKCQSIDSDLAMLVLLAQTLAPYLYTLEDLEQLQRDNERLRARAGESNVLIGQSKAMRQVRKLITQAAKSELPVLITGDTGTGKELTARMLLAQSPRHSKPFVVVNCAAIPRDLFEGELFGHVKGAFTGATEAKPGLLEQADGGTLFLDEVGDLSLDNQARILRVIEYGTFRRVGAATESKVNVSIIAATNKDLPAAIQDGSFREDLYHRLNGFGIHIPPLRERPSDISLLATHFFEMSKSQARHPLTAIAPDAMQYLSTCAWPGNARQLRSRIQRAVAIAPDSIIQLADVRVDGPEPAHAGDVHMLMPLHEVERRHIEAALAACDGDIQKTAKVLQIGRSTLYRKMEEYRLKR